MAGRSVAFYPSAREIRQGGNHSSAMKVRDSVTPRKNPQQNPFFTDPIKKQGQQ